jgi:hypothetical protein
VRSRNHALAHYGCASDWLQSSASTLPNIHLVLLVKSVSVLIVGFILGEAATSLFQSKCTFQPYFALAESLKSLCEMDYSLEHHRSYIGRPALDLPTPSLILSKKTLEENITKLHEDVIGLGIDFRPHTKTLKVHKLTTILLSIQGC